VSKSGAKRRKKYNVTILTGVWGRPCVTRIMYQGMASFAQAASQYGWQIRHLVVGSFEREHAHMAEEFGAEYIDHPNLPLGRKWNAGMKHAMERHDFDYLMLLGSDDVLSPKMIAPYTQAMDDGLAMFGIPDMYALDLSRMMGTYFQGYKDPYPRIALGAGRMHSREAMECVNGNFYAPWVNRGLDTSSRARFLYHGVEETLLPPMGAVLDLKTAHNLNAYGAFNKDLADELSWEDIGKIMELDPCLLDEYVQNMANMSA
jgi:glycosyltransferase involved in cell wall biosynthesis